jgi:hypothetical protein
MIGSLRVLARSDSGSDNTLLTIYWQAQGADLNNVSSNPGLDNL